MMVESHQKVVNRVNINQRACADPCSEQRRRVVRRAAFRASWPPLSALTHQPTLAFAPPPTPTQPLMYAVACAKVVLALGAFLGIPFCTDAGAPLSAKRRALAAAAAGGPLPPTVAAVAYCSSCCSHLRPDSPAASVLSAPAAAPAVSDLPTPLRRWLHTPDPHELSDGGSTATPTGQHAGAGRPAALRIEHDASCSADTPPRSPFSCNSVGSGGSPMRRRMRGVSLPGLSTASSSHQGGPRQSSSGGGGAVGGQHAHAHACAHACAHGTSNLSVSRRASSVCSVGSRRSSGNPGNPGRRGNGAGSANGGGGQHVVGPSVFGTAYQRLRDRAATLRAEQAALRAEQEALENERARIEETGFHREATAMQQRLDLVSARRSIDARSAELAMRLDALDEAWRDLMEREASSNERQRQLAQQAAAVDKARAVLQEQEAEIAEREAAVDSMQEVIAALTARLSAVSPSAGGGGGSPVTVPLQLAPELLQRLRSAPASPQKRRAQQQQQHQQQQQQQQQAAFAAQQQEAASDHHQQQQQQQQVWPAGHLKSRSGAISPGRLSSRSPAPAPKATIVVSSSSRHGSPTHEFALNDDDNLLIAAARDGSPNSSSSKYPTAAAAGSRNASPPPAAAAVDVAGLQPFLGDASWWPPSPLSCGGAPGGGKFEEGAVVGDCDGGMGHGSSSGDELAAAALRRSLSDAALTAVGVIYE